VEFRCGWVGGQELHRRVDGLVGEGGAVWRSSPGGPGRWSPSAANLRAGESWTAAAAGEPVERVWVGGGAAPARHTGSQERAGGRGVVPDLGRLALAGDGGDCVSGKVGRCRPRWRAELERGSLRQRCGGKWPSRCGWCLRGWVVGEPSGTGALGTRGGWGRLRQRVGRSCRGGPWTGMGGGSCHPGGCSAERGWAVGESSRNNREMAI
jgi:hypothetical protein